MTLDHLLNTTPIRAIMTPAVQTVMLGTPLQQSLEHMVSANVGSLVVIKRKASPLVRQDVAGLAPVFFVIREYMKTREAGAPIESAMFTDFILARADDNVAQVAGRIVDNKTWRMIVTDENDCVVGLVSATDIMRFIAESLTGRREP